MTAATLTSRNSITLPMISFSVASSSPEISESAITSRRSSTIWRVAE
jgi:hypothetical protein